MGKLINNGKNTLPKYGNIKDFLATINTPIERGITNVNIKKIISPKLFE
ncbi:MAG: hypothetical protein ACTSRG_04725 [Candidatus Helarchaeota archaeon]